MKNLNHLKAVGLLNITEFEGQHEGNEYEIFLPEEIGVDAAQLTRPTPPNPPHLPQAGQSPSKVGTLPTAESGVGGVGLISINSVTSTDFKTYFKDIELSDDDLRAIAKFIEELNVSCRKITGRDLTSRDFTKLAEDLSEILISETVLAAARTKSVSTFIAFMTENMRRRLYAKPRSEKTKTEPRPTHLDIGKGSELPEAEPLGESRTAVLESLRQVAEQNGPQALEIFRPNYTADDWKWLVTKLGINEN